MNATERLRAPRIRWSRILRQAAPMLIIAAPCTVAAAADTPDLVSLSVVGPQQIHVSDDQLVGFNVANLGDPWMGSYTVEIVLSVDDVVDPTDLLLASVNRDGFGMQSALVTVPFETPVGNYRWGVRILPVAGEVATWNNAVTGTEAYVVKADLYLPDADAITLAWRPSDSKVPVADIAVENAGSLGSILVYTVTPLAPAPWLDIDPPAGFAIAGEESAPVVLTAIPNGLALGSHSTTLRFQAYPELNDYVDVEVTLVIGHPKFIPGDRLAGEIATIGDMDVVEVDLLKGERLRLALKSFGGTLNTHITLIDPDGIEEAKLAWKHNKSVVTKTRKVAKSGTYTLRITGTTECLGSYQIRTGSKLPKEARPRLVTVKPGAGDAARIEVLARDGAMLDFGVDPDAQFGGPMCLLLNMPTGAVHDLGAMAQSGPSDTVLVEGVPMEGLGSFWIELQGFGNPDARARVSVFPIQPPKFKKKIYLP